MGSLIHKQQHGTVTLLGIDAHMSLPGACRDLPVDGADVVARQIAAQLFEVETAPPQAGGMLTGENTVHRLPREKRVSGGLVPQAQQMVQRDMDPVVLVPGASLGGVALRYEIRTHDHSYASATSLMISASA